MTHCYQTSITLTVTHYVENDERKTADGEAKIAAAQLLQDLMKQSKDNGFFIDEEPEIYTSHIYAD